MKIKSLALLYLPRLKANINDYFFKAERRKKQTNFVRNRKISFAAVICQMLNFHTRSSAMETYNYTANILEGEPVSRQAFDAREIK